VDVELSSRPAEPAAVTELRALSRRAQAGDPAALPRIRDILDAHPEVWRYVGDLAALAERVWAEVLAAGDPLAAESMRRTAAALRAELAGEHPSALERLLVDQVVACWMEVKFLECRAADPGRGSLDQANFRLKRLESAQKRYLAAVKTLTDVRARLPASRSPSTAARLYDEPGLRTA
jgi:hypothetical protein